MQKKSTPAPQRAGTEIDRKRARLVQLMLEIASLDRDEYRRLRAEMWKAVAASHPRKRAEEMRRWRSHAS